LTGKDKKTPAQRLGITKKAYTVRDILYYKWGGCNMLI
jgi:hypothetical protein